jgi:hypothetical protein
MMKAQHKPTRWELPVIRYKITLNCGITKTYVRALSNQIRCQNQHLHISVWKYLNTPHVHLLVLISNLRNKPIRAHQESDWTKIFCWETGAFSKNVMKTVEGRSFQSVEEIQQVVRILRETCPSNGMYYLSVLSGEFMKEMSAEWTTVVS